MTDAAAPAALSRGGFVKGFLGDSGKVLSLKIASALLNYGLVLSLALWLSPTDYGHFAAIMSAMTFAGYVCGLGINVSIIRFLGPYEAKGEAALARGIVFGAERALWTTVLVCGVLGAAGFALAGSFGVMDRGWVYAAAALLILPGFTVMETQSAVLRTFGHIGVALAPKDLGWRGMVLMTGLVLSLTLAPGDRLAPLILVSGLAISVLVVIQRAILHRALAARVGGHGPIEYDWRGWRASSSAIWVTQIARASFGSLDVLLIGALLSVEVAGLYFVAVRTADVLNFLMASLNLIVGPTVARKHAEGHTSELNAFLALITLVMAGLAGTALALLVLAGEWLLGSVDERFLSAYSAILILFAGQVVYASMGSVGVVLTMTGHERLNMVLLLIFAPAMLALMAVLAPLYGLVGAASASSIGLIGWTFAVWLCVRRLTPYDPSLLNAPRVLLRFVADGAATRT